MPLRQKMGENEKRFVRKFNTRTGFRYSETIVVNMGNLKF